MTDLSIARRRLRSQRLLEPPIILTAAAPEDVVRWLGAVQAQEYTSAKWAVAQRCTPADAGETVTAQAVDRALDEGRIFRTHVLRPTWHFIAPQDVRWMLALTGPRVLRGMAARHRELLLDEAVFTQTHAVFRETLSGGRQAVRAELETALNRAGIATDLPQRFAHIVMQAELTGLLISGAWRGKQNTYALLDDCVPPAAAPFDRDWAVAELARRFFTSHGPATLKDFAWWSGLTLTDGRAGVAAAGDALAREELGGIEYYGPPDTTLPPPDSTVRLLPSYDEYVVAYTDRGAIFDPAESERLHLRGGVLNNIIVRDGLVIGGWSREIGKKAVKVTAWPFQSLAAADRSSLETAAHRYADHLELKLQLEIIDPS